MHKQYRDAIIMHTIKMAAARSGNALRKNIPLLSKFEGAMVGAVLGDCLGSEFEFTGSTMDEVNSYFTTVKDNNSEGKQGGETSTV